MEGGRQEKHSSLTNNGIPTALMESSGQLSILPWCTISSQYGIERQRKRKLTTVEARMEYRRYQRGIGLGRKDQGHMITRQL